MLANIASYCYKTQDITPALLFVILDIHRTFLNTTDTTLTYVEVKQVKI